MSEKPNIRIVRAGAPSKYTEEVPQKLLDYFSEIKPLELNGKQVGFELPTIEKFCCDIGIVKQTFYNWTEQHEKLLDAFNKAKSYQKHWIVQLANNGIYKEGFAKFTAINCTDMRDKIEQTIDQKTIQINIDKDDEGL